MKFLDTNIFIRCLVPDDPVKSRACFSLLEAVKHRTETATTSETVIAEVAYVLRSKRQYDLEPPEITARLRPIISLRGLVLQNKRTFLRAFDLWDEHPGLDFEDVLTIAHMERLRLTEIYSYDRDFDKIPGISRVDPATNRP